MKAIAALRPAKSADYGFLWRLHCATMKTYVDLTWGWVESAQRAMFRERFDPGRLQVITVQGQDAGVLSVERRGGEIFSRQSSSCPSCRTAGSGVPSSRVSRPRPQPSTCRCHSMFCGQTPRDGSTNDWGFGSPARTRRIT